MILRLVRSSICAIVTRPAIVRSASGEAEPFSLRLALPRTDGGQEDLAQVSRAEALGLPATRRERAAARVASAPGYSYFIGSAVFHYLGPAFAVLLFSLVAPLGVAWLRIATAAGVYAAWRRPWRRLRDVDAATVRTIVGMGVVLGLMNPCFYLAIERLPLGTVAAIEFLPVLALAALGVRSGRNGLALVAAAGGVYLLTEVRPAGEAAGFAFAFANAALFALYIVLAHRVSRSSRLGGIDGLATAMLVALLVVTPIGGLSAAPALIDPVALAAGFGVGIASSVIPYVCDQLAMAKMTRSTYALFVSLLPATATIIGAIVLAQIPTPLEVAAIFLVVVGVAIHQPPP